MRSDFSLNEPSAIIRFSLSMEMSRLTRDGTAEPVSRDQILRHARGQRNIIKFPCSADHEQDWQPYPVDPYSAICDDHTYIHTVDPSNANPARGHKKVKKVNESRHHGDNNLLLKPTGIQIMTKSLPVPSTRKRRKLIGVKTI